MIIINSSSGTENMLKINRFELVSLTREKMSEREKALNTTLEENSDLSEILIQRTEEVEQLKTEKKELVKENEVLRLKSQKIDELAEILDELVCESSSSSL